MWKLVNSLKCSTTDIKTGRREDHFMTYSDRRHLFLSETVDIANIGTVFQLFVFENRFAYWWLFSLDTRLI